LDRKFLFPEHPSANSVTMSTLTAHCRWEDEMARDRPGHSPSYAFAEEESNEKI